MIKDFFPAILEMADITRYHTVQRVDGVSFVPLLKGIKSAFKERALLLHYPNSWGPKVPGIEAGSAVRLGHWKLIFYHSDRSFELFHLAEDIGEKHNRVNDHPAKAKQLASLLGESLQKMNAQTPRERKTVRQVPWPDNELMRKIEKNGTIRETSLWQESR